MKIFIEVELIVSKIKGDNRLNLPDDAEEWDGEDDDREYVSLR